MLRPALGDDGARAVATPSTAVGIAAEAWLSAGEGVNLCLYFCHFLSGPDDLERIDRFTPRGSRSSGISSRARYLAQLAEHLSV